MKYVRVYVDVYVCIYIRGKQSFQMGRFCWKRERRAESDQNKREIEGRDKEKGK